VTFSNFLEGNCLLLILSVINIDEFVKVINANMFIVIKINVVSNANENLKMMCVYHKNNIVVLNCGIIFKMFTIVRLSIASII
jgi:hypothetical protein